MPNADNDEVGNPIPAEIRTMVADHGWAAVAVDSQPPFSYTAGLWRLSDHPELIVTGLPAETAKWLLDRAVAMVRDGKPLKTGVTVPGLIGKHSAAIRDVELSQLPQLAFAADLYQGVLFTAVQIVWPDRDGRYPSGQACRSTDSLRDSRCSSPNPHRNAASSRDRG